MIHNVKVENSVYFQEVLEINFLDANLDNKKGITLITGGNGVGKSSLLEFATPYRKLPSRPGAFKKHFKNECGSVTSIWTINDIKYEFIVKCNKNLTECYIYKIEKDGTKNNLLSSTSTEDYDTMLESICGSEEIFFRTIFKNSKNNVGELKESNKKDFFLNLVGAQMYAIMKDISLKEKNKFKNDKELLDDIAKKIIDYLDAPENQDLDTKIKETENELSDTYEKIEKTILDIKVINDNNLKLITENSKKNINIMDINNLKERKIEIEDQINIIIKEINESNLIIKNNKDKIIELNKEIKEFEELINKYKNPKSILKRKKELEKDIPNLEELYENNNKILLSIKNNEILLANSLKKLDTLYDNLEIAKKEYNLANESKCEVDPSLCKNSFIIENLITNIDAIDLKIKNFKDSNLIENIKVNIQKDKEKLNYKSFNNIDEIEIAIKLLKKELNEIPKDIETIVSETNFSTLTLIEKKKKVYEINNNNKTESKNVEENIAKQDLKVSMLVDLDIKINNLVEESLKLEEIEHINVEDKENELKLLNQKKDELLINSTKLIFSIENIKKQQEELSILNLKIDDLKEKIKRREFVEDFCNTKDGMPALKLKYAGKEIQDRANQILSVFRKTGINYQVEFIWNKKDSTGKKDLDCFDIIITNDKQKKIDLNSLSAGQKIIIEIALSLAAAGENFAEKFKVLLLDEADTALDNDNAEALYKTLEIVKEDLGIEQIFIVTHNLQIQKIYPQRIKLTKHKEKY